MKTVKFWMQPIAENFFLHGFDNESEYNLFVLLAHESDDRYIIEMTNNGAKIEEARLEEINQSLLDEESDIPGTSIGIKNVNARLKYFYGNNFSMSLCNNDEAGIVVRIQILKEGNDHKHV
jgi:sensor histidine kinase YesM